MKKTEPKKSTIVAALSKKMRDHGWLVLPQRAGLPDLMVIVPPHGLTFWIEAKQPGYVPTKPQWATDSKLREAGSPVYVVTSSGDHVIEWLDREMALRIAAVRSVPPWRQSVVGIDYYVMGAV